MTAHERRCEVGEASVVADRLVHGPALREADGEVLRTERRGEMHDAGAVVHRDEVRSHDAVRVLDVRVWRLVAGADERGSGHRADEVTALAEHGLPQRGADDQSLAVEGDLDIVGGGIDRDPGVRRQGPRCRGPHDHRGAHEPGVVRRLDREPHVHARVVDGLVPQRDLCIGQGGAAAGAVRRDLVRFLQQAPLEQRLQRPPHRLDVAGRHRPVGLVEVDPVADALGEPLELAHVSLDRLAAPLVELGDPERLDIALAGGADLLLDLELDRQAVTVPPALARHEVAGHRLEPGVDVLERAGLHMVHAGSAVRGRWPLVEHPQRRALAPGERGVEDVVLLPEREDLPLELREARLRVNRLERRHLPSSLPRSVGAPDTPNAPPQCRDEASSLPRGTTPRCRALTGRGHSRPRTKASRCHGRNPPASPTADRPARTGARG